MAKHSDVARGYAEGLMVMAAVEGAVDALGDQLYELGKGITGNPQLRDFLADAEIPAEEKKRALKEMLSESASPLLRGAVEMLIDMGKAGVVSEVAAAYVDMLQKTKKQVLAEVTSVVPLTPELAEKLQAELGKSTGKQVSVKNVVDKKIVGGLVIKIEDKIVDLSVRKKLDSLRDSLRAGI